MRGDDGGLIPPGAFLPTAERFGLIEEIDGWTLGRALQLAAAGRSVAVLDRSAPASARSGDVLPPTARPVLEELGVWDRFRSDGHLASPGILSAWGHEEPVSQDFIWSPYGDGWHVDRRRFDEMLVRAAEEAGATVYRAARAKGGLLRGRGWQVDAVTDGPIVRLDAEFLVEAAGRASSLSRLPAARKTIYDRLVGVVATVEPSCGEVWVDHRMLLEAAEDGWWYSAPIPGPRLVVAWMTDPDLRNKTAGRLRDLWHHELDRVPHTRARVPPRAVARVGVIAANSYCRRAAHGRWLAVGDAAAAYDPLSGQGIVQALKMGQEAAAAVVAAQTGATRALDDYADAVAEGFHQYLRLRREYYRAERRWPNSPFWNRRRVDPDLLTSPF
jgi:flavin-dependent dehydrogenase